MLQPWANMFGLKAKQFSKLKMFRPKGKMFRNDIQIISTSQNVWTRR
jgi:hypothetical protein